MKLHTKGPWASTALSSDPHNIRYITGPYCEAMATIHHTKEMSQEEALANAKLIAVAPELLEVLELARDYLRKHGGSNHPSCPTPYSVIRVIDAVVAKTI